MRTYIKNCKNKDINFYIKAVLKKTIKTNKDVYKQCEIVKKEFENGNIEVDEDLYEKYIKIGYLFFNEIFPYQKCIMALSLCTFYKGTKRPRWNKLFMMMGRGGGKDGMIAWFSTCLTSKYHGIRKYDVDIIGNNIDQSSRPLEDIMDMVASKNKYNLYEKKGDSVISLATNSKINARSSDAKQQDGLRSGAVVFNEVHAYENYSRFNVMITGLGKIDDPRTFYFTTNGDIRGGVLDDMLGTIDEVLHENVSDRRMLSFVYRLNEKKEIYNKENWVMSNPSMPYRETLKDEIEEEYEDWIKNPSKYPAFPQKRMGLSENSCDKVVAEWEIIEKTEQEYDYNRLKKKSCILGIDLSKTTDWTSINFLFYDDEIDKWISINHSFICANNRDLKGIKAPYEKWCEQGLATMVYEKEVSPEFVIDYAINFADNNDFYIETIVIDEFKKGLMIRTLEEIGYSKEANNLRIIRPSDIAANTALINSCFINERFIWNNRMLMWACNNTKVISWKPRKSTGDAELGNELYAKINPRFRKTDPFMAFVHSFIVHDKLIGISEQQLNLVRGF